MQPLLTPELPPSPRPGPRPDAEGSLRSSLREVAWFLPLLGPDRRRVVGALLLSLAGNCLRLPLLFLPAILTAHFEPAGAEPAGFPAWLGRAVLDPLRAAFGPTGCLAAAVAIAFVCILLLAPLALVRNYWNGLVGANLLLWARLGVFENLRRLGMASVYERGAGAFVQRLTRDLLLLYDLFALILPGALTLALQVVVFLGALLLLDPLLTLFVLAVYVALQPVLLLCNRRINRQANILQQLHEDLSAQMVESVGGFRDIAAAGYFDRMAKRFRDRAEGLRREGIGALLWAQASELFLSVAFSLLTVVPYFVALGRLDRVDRVGEMITYVGLLSSLLPALASLWGNVVDTTLATPSLRAIRQVLTASGPAPAARPPARPRPGLPARVERIRFEGVSLDLDGRAIVRDLTFDVVGGQLTALIGQSGAGKTTIFHLLLRLVAPTSGTIRINDTPLADFAEDDLRRLIGFIPQSPFIFNASLRDNLLVAAALPENTEALLAEVTRDARLEELVRSRRQEGGLDAAAGYLGMRLSGGEKQRIALGRLLVQDPQVIVADEYTANIDVQTSQLIQDMMRTRFADRTRLVITHELYNARGADRILVLDHGQIVQAGTHRDLLAQAGLYRSMWETQRLE